MSKLCLKCHGIDHIKNIIDGDNDEGLQHLEESLVGLTKTSECSSVPIDSEKYPLGEYSIDNNGKLLIF